MKKRRGAQKGRRRKRKRRRSRRKREVAFLFSIFLSKFNNTFAASERAPLEQARNIDADDAARDDAPDISVQDVERAPGPNYMQNSFSDGGSNSTTPERGSPVDNAPRIEESAASPLSGEGGDRAGRAPASAASSSGVKVRQLRPANLRVGVIPRATIRGQSRKVSGRRKSNGREQGRANRLTATTAMQPRNPVTGLYLPPHSTTRGIIPSSIKYGRNFSWPSWPATGFRQRCRHSTGQRI